jgi:hypothetical protein
MSMPTTCNTIMVPGGQHDVVFHMLYGSNTGLSLAMVRAMANRLNKISKTTHLSPILKSLSDDTAPAADLIRGVWILLLNVDMRTKELLLEPTQKGVQRLALSFEGADKESLERSCASLAMMKPMDKGKAARFLMDLHTELVPWWLQNEALCCQDLVRGATSLYLNS